MQCKYVGCDRPAEYKLTNGHNTICCCEQCAPSWVTGCETELQRKARECGLVVENVYTVEAL